MNQLQLTSSNTVSANDLIAQLQKANQTVCQMTADLKNFNNSISRKNLLLENNTSNSQCSYQNEIPINVSTQNKHSSKSSLSNSLNSTNSQISSYYDGQQTIINFPFMTYTNESDDMIDTRANQRSQNENETEESSTRKYYIKVQDLEYEEFENSENPSLNYKQIKYPYQQWQRVQQAPQFVQDLIAEQKRGQSESQQPEFLEVSFQLGSPQESQFQQSPKQENECNLAVKSLSYIPKSSISLLDETYYKSSSDISLSASYTNGFNYNPQEL